MCNNVPLDESGLTTTVGVVQAYLSTAESCDATRGRSKPRRDAYLYLNGFRPYISGSTLPHIHGLEILVKTSVSFASEYGVTFNAKTTECICFSKNA